MSLGKGVNHDFFSWHHSCISIDFIEGSTKLFENGRKIFEKYGVEAIQRAYRENKKEIDIISVGCVLFFAHFDKGNQFYLAQLTQMWVGGWCRVNPKFYKSLFLWHI